MTGTVVVISPDELREMIYGAVAEAVWKASGRKDSSETMAFCDIKERWGVSRSTCLRMMREGRFPQPVNSGTREYRFRTGDVEAAMERRTSEDRKTRIRPDMRSRQ